MSGADLLGAAQIATPVVIVVGGWLIKNAFGRFTDQLAAVKQSQIDLKTQLEKQAAALQEHAGMDDREHDSLLKGKVDLEDFVREMSRTRQTLEEVRDGQSRLEGAFGIGARIASALESLAKKNEGSPS